MMHWSNAISRFSPAFSTMSAFADLKLAVPCTTVTLRCFAMPASPFVSWPTTLSFIQLRSFARSTFGSPKSRPKARASCVSSMTRAAWSSAFDGMQPTFKHTPPSVA